MLDAHSPNISHHRYIPRVKTKAATRAFSVPHRIVWNSLLASSKLEDNIASFRRRLNPISLMLPTLLTFLVYLHPFANYFLVYLHPFANYDSCIGPILRLQDCLIHLPVSFGRDTKSRWSLLSGVYGRGSKRSHTRGKCVICSGLTNSKEEGKEETT